MRVFTGKLTNRTRSEAQDLVLKYGGQVTNNCSKAVSLVVVGMFEKSLFQELTTKKLNWAQEHDVPVISEEEEFNKLLQK